MHIYIHIYIYIYIYKALDAGESQKSTNRNLSLF